MKVIVPLRTGAGQNDREHWRAKARRVKAERYAVAWMLALHKPPPGPVTVLMTRVAPGNGLDAHDNLRASLKAPVDQVADWLGRDDADPSITWKYDQRRGKPGEWLVGIEVEQAGANFVRETRCIDGSTSDRSNLSVEVMSGRQYKKPCTFADANKAKPPVAGGGRTGEKGVPIDVVKRQHAPSVAHAGRALKGAR